MKKSYLIARLLFLAVMWFAALSQANAETIEPPIQSVVVAKSIPFAVTLNASVVVPSTCGASLSSVPSDLTIGSCNVATFVISGNIATARAPTLYVVSTQTTIVATFTLEVVDVTPAVVYTLVTGVLFTRNCPLPSYVTSVTVVPALPATIHYGVKDGGLVLGGVPNSDDVKNQVYTVIDKDGQPWVGVAHFVLSIYSPDKSLTFTSVVGKTYSFTLEEMPMPQPTAWTPDPPLEGAAISFSATGSLVLSSTTVPLTDSTTNYVIFSSSRFLSVSIIIKATDKFCTRPSSPVGLSLNQFFLTSSTSQPQSTPLQLAPYSSLTPATSATTATCYSLFTVIYATAAWSPAVVLTFRQLPTTIVYGQSIVIIVNAPPGTTVTVSSDPLNPLAQLSTSVAKGHGLAKFTVVMRPSSLGKMTLFAFAPGYQAVSQDVVVTAILQLKTGSPPTTMSIVVLDNDRHELPLALLPSSTVHVVANTFEADVALKVSFMLPTPTTVQTYQVTATYVIDPLVSVTASATVSVASQAVTQVTSSVSSVSVASTDPDVSPPSGTPPCVDAVTQISFHYFHDSKDRTLDFYLKSSSKTNPLEGLTGPATFGQTFTTTTTTNSTTTTTSLPTTANEIVTTSARAVEASNPTQYGLYQASAQVEHPSIHGYAAAGIKSFQMDGVTYVVDQSRVLEPAVHTSTTITTTATTTTTTALPCWGVRLHRFLVVAERYSGAVQVEVGVQETSVLQ